MSTVIKVENLSKLYRLGQVGTGTMSNDLNRWWHRMRGKEDPFLKIGEENDRTKKSSSHFVWALRDINFSVKDGEVLGIIGRNGAGKSTLLKILSRTTAPTSGAVKIKGRIASLLEVGTGFHPDLSGRQNIYLNGAILGMTKAEIKSKFDEIVDFAGVERYIDTPVKRYSSGMYVRLAFGVAAHLEPEILIVDEVLAVGDAEFQRKCLGKMKDVSVNQGRTVLFVSHNLSAISELTNNVLYLENGKFKNYGPSIKIINDYLSIKSNANLIYEASAKENEPSLIKCIVHTSEKNNFHFFNEQISFEFHINMPFAMEGMCVSFQIFDDRERSCLYDWIFDSEHQICRQKGIYTLVCTIPCFKLYKGKYTVMVHMADQKGKHIYNRVESICPFEVIMKENHEWGWNDYTAVFMAESTWKVNRY